MGDPYVIQNSQGVPMIASAPSDSNAKTRTEDPVRHIDLDPREIRFYREEGYLIIPGLFSAETAESLRTEILENLRILTDMGAGNGKLIQSAQYLKGSKLDAYVNSPSLAHLASQLLGADAKLYLPFTAVKRAKGGGAFHLHQDGQYTRIDGGGLNIWAAMVPMSPENGALLMAPRTHKLGILAAHQSPDGDGHRETDVEPELLYPIRLNPGDAVIFGRLTIHGSGKNHTDVDRVAYAVQFHHPDARAFWPEENAWHRLSDRPKYQVGPVDRLVGKDEKGE